MAITKWSIPVEAISASLGMSQPSRLPRRPLLRLHTHNQMRGYGAVAGRETALGQRPRKILGWDNFADDDLLLAFFAFEPRYRGHHWILTAALACPPVQGAVQVIFAPIWSILGMAAPAEVHIGRLGRGLFHHIE